MKCLKDPICFSPLCYVCFALTNRVESNSLKFNFKMFKLQSEKLTREINF